MLDSIAECGRKLRLAGYHGVFRRLQERDPSLSAAEVFALDVIYLLHEPTVKQFADWIGISQPNATYKINCLIRKGYLCKIPSQEDRREAHLSVTEKFLLRCRNYEDSVSHAVQTLRGQFSQDELRLFRRMLKTFADTFETKTGRVSEIETRKKI